MRLTPLTIVVPIIICTLACGADDTVPMPAAGTPARRLLPTRRPPELGTAVGTGVNTFFIRAR